MMDSINNIISGTNYYQRYVVGMAMERDGVGMKTPKDGIFFSAPYGFVLPHPRPAPPHMIGKTFPPHPYPLGPYETPLHLIKLYFLLIYPITSTIFLMKPISLIKIYLKLQLNLSNQIKSIFKKKIK